MPTLLAYTEIYDASAGTVNIMDPFSTIPLMVGLWPAGANVSFAATVQLSCKLSPVYVCVCVSACV